VQAVVSQSGPADFYTNTFTVVASGGQMTFDWLDLGGPAAVVLINSIEIVEVVLLETLTLTIDEASISENGGTSTATLTRSGSTTGDLVVNLSSDDTGEATVPATVTILDGQVSAPLTVTGVDDAVLDGRQRVTITASASGFLNDDELIRLTDSEGIQYDVTYADGASEGFFDPILGQQRREAFDFALDIVSSLIANAYANETIEISATFDGLGGSAGSAILAGAGPTSVRSDSAGGLPNTLYGDALANHLNGSDLDAASEVVASFNSDVDNSTVLGSTDWYYGFDGNGGSDIDFITVVLHEISHGLNFLGLMNSNGSWSEGLPGVYDRLLEDSAGTRLDTLTESQRAAAIVSGGLYWGGAAGAAGNGGQRPQIYAPITYAPGSSTSHLDEGVHGNELMSPNYSGVDHAFSEIERGMLADMGWNVPTSGGGSLLSSLVWNVPAGSDGSLVSSGVAKSRSGPDGDSSDGAMAIMANPAPPLTVDQEPNGVAGHPADVQPDSSDHLRQDLTDLVFGGSEENGLWW
jgi:hypothetical protein